MKHSLPITRQRFRFEVVTVDREGKMVSREKREAVQFLEPLPGNIHLAMVAVPPGSFLIGSPPGQGYPEEHPQQLVSLPAFFISRCTVTQEQWHALMGSDPPYRCLGPKRPADRISWHMANEFCRTLTDKSGRPYRLPSEAEWEYACRAGTTTPFHCGPTLTTDLANYVGEFTYAAEPKGVYRHETTDAGRFPANSFGLHDMHGNVWEWCASAWTENYGRAATMPFPEAGSGTAYYVLRGGCWHDPPDLCRSAVRLKQRPDEPEDYFGFRIALDSPLIIH